MNYFDYGKVNHKSRVDFEFGAVTNELPRPKPNKFSIVDGEPFLLDEKPIQKRDWKARNVPYPEKYGSFVHDALCFTVYTNESDGPYQELLKIREMKLIYHLDDDSFSLFEKKTNNSGYIQGRLFRRQKVPKAIKRIGNDHLSWRDLNIGEDLNIFGQTYHITSCDEFTKRFLRSNGIQLKEEEEIVPKDSWTLSRMDKPNPNQNIDLCQNITHYQTLPNYMTFYLAWLDTENDFHISNKIKRTFKMTIDTTDDTVVMYETTPLYNNQLFLKGVKLAYFTSDGTQRYYRSGNLYPGLWIEIYSRPMFIYDAEGKDTRQYLIQQYGDMEFGSCPYDILLKGPTPKTFEISLKEMIFEAQTDALKSFQFLFVYNNDEKIVNVFEKSKYRRWSKGRPFLEEVDVSHLSPYEFDIDKTICLYKWKFKLIDASPVTREYIRFRCAPNID
uniref:DM10 domain-containing protein n=1 Tax=Rhabditophanes sp. KR3021 TaxID=114890 RepID=A0AC35UIM7_9BILA